MSLLFGFMLQASAQDGSSTGASGGIRITCRGNIGSQSVNRPLIFGGANPTFQEFAITGNISYGIQLGGYEGFIDILLVQTTHDAKGNVLSTSYVRSHGGTALDMVDSEKHINLSCAMSGL